MGELLTIRRRLLAAQPHLLTRTGGSVAFVLAEKALIKQLNISIAHTQSGAGDPSPDNVRPITGWTGCTLSHIHGGETDLHDIDWSGKATVYDGTLNLLTGRITTSARLYPASTWTWYDVTNSGYHYFCCLVSKMKESGYRAIKYCDSFVPVSPASSLPSKPTAGRIYNAYDRYYNINVYYPAIETLTEWTNFVANVGFYFGRTYVDNYTIDPQTIYTARGDNEFEANCGDVSVTAWSH